MAQAKHILERPPQFQWDTDSVPCQNSNCRCTTEAMIAGFYKDVHIAPKDMRRAMGYGACGGTDAPHGVIGLNHYGVDASWGQLTTAQVILKLNQNIPMDIAVLYGKIPRSSAYIQDMNFIGLHSVAACKRVNLRGKYGIYVRDPDRWGTGKVDSVFWPDSVWIPAFAAANYVAVWPNKPKIIQTYPYESYRYSKVMEVIANGVNQRSAPNTIAHIEASRSKGFRITTYLRTDKGGSYIGPTGTRSTSWVGWKTSDGKYHWIALGFLKTV